MATAIQFIKKTFQKEFKGIEDDSYNYKLLHSQRLMDFRRQAASIIRVERPTNLARARTLGYKAKNGFIIARVKVRKGSGSHKRPRRARKPKRMGVRKLTRNLNIQSIAEQRAARKHPNCEVLNSYWVGGDGKNQYFEVILIDVSHPEILADKKLRSFVENNQSGRVFKGLTSSGRKARGLRRKGKGAEKLRPSKKAVVRKRLSTQRKPKDF